MPDTIPPLTEWEKEVLKILRGANRAMTSAEIMAIVYKGKDAPFNARQIVNGKLDRLYRKLQYELVSGVVIVKTKVEGSRSIAYSLKETAA